MNGSLTVPKAPVARSPMPGPTNGTSSSAPPSEEPAPWMLVLPAWRTRPASENDEMTSWTFAPRRTQNDTQMHVARSAITSRARASGTSLHNFNIVASWHDLHPEDAEPRLGDRGVEGRVESQREDAPRIERVDDPVVPEPGRREIRRPLALVRVEDRRLEGIAFRVVLEPAADRGQDPGRLLATHHGDPGVRPGPQESRLVGAAGHRIVAGPEAATDEDRELWDLGVRDGHDELRPVLGDAGLLVLAPDHEARDVLEEDERDPALTGELDEMGTLERGLAEQDAVVGDDPDRVAIDVREAGDQGLAIERLEPMEP